MKFASLLLAASALVASAADSKPNFVILFADDW
jgi:hypothetical protein